MKVAICAALFFLTFATRGFSQEPNRPIQGPHISFATNECFGKGGLGIITPGLYINLRTERNQLLLADGKKWIGKDAQESETVIVFHGQAWQQVPEGFDLATAMVVSFEKDRVRFFDFNRMEGGFYRRDLSRH
jgi:hypothetical protein